MLKWINENSVTVRQAEKMTAEQLEGKLVIGKFVDREQEDYSTKYQKLIEKAQKSI